MVQEPVVQKLFSLVPDFPPSLEFLLQLLQFLHTGQAADPPAPPVPVPPPHYLHAGMSV
jgi:hypothetical protein